MMLLELCYVNLFAVGQMLAVCHVVIFVLIRLQCFGIVS